MSNKLNQLFRKTTALVAIAAMVITTIPNAAQALDVSSGNVTHTGNIAINQVGGTTNINQSTARETINWGTFNIDAAETVNFNSARTSDITINRVNGGSRSMIAGMLNSNHTVAVLNNSGITFTAGSKVNVGSLIATTARDFDLKGDKYNFTNVNGTGSVINQGEINVSDGGYAVLVAPEVANQGTIKAKLGRVDLASANGFTIDVNGNGNINYLAGADLEKAIVTNSGTINALGGVVNLRSDKAKSLADSVINLNGVINVDGMDSGVIGTTANGSAILATAYGNINAGSDLRAGRIELASLAGDINTKNLTSINGKFANTAKAIKLNAGGKIKVDGKITAHNIETLDSQFLECSGIGCVPVRQKALADVEVVSKKGAEFTGDIDVKAETLAGGTAKLNVNGGTGDVLTNGLVNVEAKGVRLVEVESDTGSIMTEATADFVGANIVHNKDVNVEAYAFHDIKTIIEYLSHNAGEKTAIGYYVKDKNGNPVEGKVLMSNLEGLVSGIGEISSIDTQDIGFFVIPDGSEFATLTEMQDVKFANVGGKWVVQNTSNQNISSTTGAINTALFSDNALNPASGNHVGNGSAEGNMNWGKVAGVFGDANFNKTETSVGDVVSKASYNANATGNYTANGDVIVDSTANAKTGETTANLKIAATGDINLNGDTVAATARAYKVAKADVLISSSKGSVTTDAEVLATTFAANRQLGEATSNITIEAAKDLTTNALVLTESTAGLKATSTTKLTVNTDLVNEGGVLTINDLVGANTTTNSGTNATSTVEINGGKVGGVVFADDAYAFTITNGVVQSGRSSMTKDSSTITVTELATKTAKKKAKKKSGHKKSSKKKKSKKKVTHKKSSKKMKTTSKKVRVRNNFFKTKKSTMKKSSKKTHHSKKTTKKKKKTVHRGHPPKKKTVTTKFIRVTKTDTSNNTYGSGHTQGQIGFDPYLQSNVVINRLPVIPPVTPPTPSPDPNLLFPDYDPEPKFVRKEPASGGGLFCRDVNTAGLMGLCGAAPVREVAFAPAVIQQPVIVAEEAPKYVSPFRKGTSKSGKKLANIEPASGGKCLNVSGKKVCIEEQIDK